MASGHLGLVIRSLERLFHGGSIAGMSEVQLIERFVAGRDAAAFEALVARHGAMVLGVCRQWLRNPHDVEDAFQATFLVLVRKASTLRDRELLANWLYGVAYRVAIRARCEAARRGARESPVGDVAEDPDVERQGDCPWLHEEVRRLPEKYRAPIVLCYLEGLTHEQAAEQLGWPIGTVKGRLSRARDLLRSRLSRRGLAPSAGSLAVLLSRDASAAVPSTLLEGTVEAASRLAAGDAVAAGAISAQAAALTKGVCHAMFLAKLKVVAASVVAAALVTTGAGVIANQAPGGGDSTGRSGGAPVPVAPVPVAPAVAAAEEGTLGSQVPPAAGEPVAANPPNPVPDGPRARSRVDIAREAIRAMETQRRQGKEVDPDRFYEWSVRLREAERQAAGNRAERVAAAQAHHDRMKRAMADARRQHASGQRSILELLEAQFRNEEALQSLESTDVEQAAAAAKPAPNRAGPGGGAMMMAGGGTGGRPGMSGAGGGGFGGGAMGGQAVADAAMVGGGFGDVSGLEPHELRIKIAQIAPLVEARDKSPHTQAIRKKLEQPISMSFANEVPLEDVLKYVKSATAGGNDKGIPIYVDPVGLQEAEKTMTSPVTLDLDGVPLKTTLRLVLKQLGLAYCVRDGILIISSVEEIYNELEEAEKSRAAEGAAAGGGAAP